MKQCDTRLMPRQHHHRTKRRAVRPFVGPLDSYRPNVAAHGGVTYYDECGCGAVRRVNVNQGHHEYGTWSVPGS